ncbi:glycosyltransferase 87 family protein [Mycobacterium bourgelatii]|uniref:Polyprenol-phosphate-mannose-dependent alpha-(1-2)-phosphatidylinositol mannoside mannosyltransferase n=1 Tax=Mycobacterium bourgelatii TaxID=1273442 RepID=A0A7I9YRB4_MYCBU|nr:glycosyltransferase 87 family protein [Mycobacterium bourgelatii]MCV6974310.1 DUF2029 domain-containing protein [Mycobacterium bourgelatii]GFG91229.1 polyprenol-phosphate-mannose-dependent alpha-(1-2)-phosphatidylinositol mannoside mannosyltransferase [Mycobacterium bourgelatii]
MSNWRSPEVGSRLGRVLVWSLLWLVAGWALSRLLRDLFVNPAYRIDIDVYQMGAQAWLDGRPLYDGVLFHTPIVDLPFTYPPLAAVFFSPFAWLKMPAAGAVITALTLVVLLLSTTVVLTRLDIWSQSKVLSGPAWVRRVWLAVMIVVPASIYLEPLNSNFAYGQINAILMTLVIIDTFPRHTPWPRGLALGIGIALKLTPAVFLLYFLLRRDNRAALTALATFVGATLVGFVLAWRDSWSYWTHTLHHTDRIGEAALNTDQNIAGGLARLGLDEHERFPLWVLACLLVLAVTIWAMRRVLKADEPMLAVICVALFGLVVSPVSWSHHWVWLLPAVLVLGTLAWRRRNVALGLLTLAGLALTHWTPIDLMPKHHELTASWWRQLLGMSYVWWALAVIIAAGATVTAQVTAQRSSTPNKLTPVPAAG